MWTLTSLPVGHWNRATERAREDERKKKIEKNSKKTKSRRDISRQLNVLKRNGVMWYGVAMSEQFFHNALFYLFDHLFLCFMLFLIDTSLIYCVQMASDFGNPLKKFKLVFLGEQSGTLSSNFVGIQ